MLKYFEYKYIAIYNKTKSNFDLLCNLYFVDILLTLRYELILDRQFHF